MMRIGLFLVTNLAVMLVFGIILSLTGIERQSMSGLLIMAALFGFGGSVVLLLFSKTIAIRSVGAQVTLLDLKMRWSSGYYLAFNAKHNLPVLVCQAWQFIPRPI